MALGLRLLLEADAAFTIGPDGCAGLHSFTVSSNGTWSLADQKGTVAFSKGVFHTINMTMSESDQAVHVDGKLLATIKTKGSVDGWRIKATMNQYVFAQVDDFTLRQG